MSVAEKSSLGADNFFEKLSAKIGSSDWSSFMASSKDFVHFQNVFGVEDRFFDLDSFDHVIKNRPLKSEDLEFFKSGKWFDGKNILSKKEFEFGMKLSDLEKDGIFQLLEEGYSLRLNEIQRFSEALSELVLKASAHSICSLSLNGYFTLKNSSCLLPHSDEQRLFIVQVSGEKNWYLGHSIPENFETQSPQVVLRKGDVLFIPQGMRHAAACRDSHSLHLTLAFNERRFNEYINFCLSQQNLQILLEQKISENFEQRQKQLTGIVDRLMAELKDVEQYESFLRRQPFVASTESIRKKFSI